MPASSRRGPCKAGSFHQRRGLKQPDCQSVSAIELDFCIGKLAPPCRPRSIGNALAAGVTPSHVPSIPAKLQKNKGIVAFYAQTCLPRISAAQECREVSTTYTWGR